MQHTEKKWSQGMIDEYKARARGPFQCRLCSSVYRRGPDGVYHFGANRPCYGCCTWGVPIEDHTTALDSQEKPFVLLFDVGGNAFQRALAPPVHGCGVPVEGQDTSPWLVGEKAFQPVLATSPNDYVEAQREG